MGQRVLLTVVLIYADLAHFIIPLVVLVVIGILWRKKSTD